MATSAIRQNFINQHRQEVIDATKGTGIFPSVKMAQMIIESSDNKGIPGAGITAVKAKNYFGIKANSAWTGEKMAFNTPKDGQPVNYFRVYPSVKDSIIDHTAFLKNNSRYKKAGLFDAKTPQEQLKALTISKYAEDPNYAVMLAKIIKDYNLEDLDRQQKLQTTNLEVAEYAVKKNPFLTALLIVGVAITVILMIKNNKK